jgi:urocanate hydratase
MRLPERSAVHDQYLALSRLADTAFDGQTSGKLLLLAGFDPDGIAVILASSIAGFAVLCVKAEAELLREGMRAGFCDFVVGHLDEALRILKNELRRGRPISVGLTSDPDSCIAEMVERGLQPDLVSQALASPAWATFCERGATPVPASASQETRSLVEWSIDQAASMSAVAQLAETALDPKEPDTAARRGWLLRSPAYLGRALGAGQSLRMTADETALFVPAVRSRFPSCSLTVRSAQE